MSRFLKKEPAPAAPLKDSKVQHTHTDTHRRRPRPLAHLYLSVSLCLLQKSSIRGAPEPAPAAEKPAVPSAPASTAPELHKPTAAPKGVWVRAQGDAHTLLSLLLTLSLSLCLSLSLRLFLSLCLSLSLCLVHFALLPTSQLPTPPHHPHPSRDHPAT